MVFSFDVYVGRGCGAADGARRLAPTEVGAPRTTRPPDHNPTAVKSADPTGGRACGTIGLLDMKVKVKSQVNLKEGTPFPPRTQSGSLRPPYLGLRLG